MIDPKGEIPDDVVTFLPYSIPSLLLTSSVTHFFILTGQ